ncbi:MAG: EpsI family protein [Verrucomicrobiales bacterium]|nr:EpsI family protein [Verrucomicrobiales bacterium]
MPKATLIPLTLFSAVIGILWAFPVFWYSDGRPANRDYAWFAEQSAIPGWKFQHVPVGKAAEAILVADTIVNGEFTGTDGRSIQVYAAKRYLEKENQIGLFSHTPDRCWTALGWRIDSAERDYVECRVHGLPMLFERRIFTAEDQRRLVYFGALVGGKPLPYRIDQYFKAGLKRKAGTPGDTEGTWQRVMQPRLWSWAWESFVNRTPLSGPQQFIRISTPILQPDAAGADQLLQQFLPQWLVPTEFLSEFSAWKATPPNEKAKQTMRPENSGTK